LREDNRRIVAATAADENENTDGTDEQRQARGFHTDAPVHDYLSKSIQAIGRVL
jgi:hypothetical protein